MILIMEKISMILNIEDFPFFWDKHDTDYGKN
jgi:hypothetical protein